MIKLKPKNSTQEISSMTGTVYHVLSKYSIWNFGEERFNTIADKKHPWGNCTHCRAAQEKIDQQTKKMEKKDE